MARLFRFVPVLPAILIGLLFTSAAASEEKTKASAFLIDLPLGLIEPDIPIDSPLTRQLVELGQQIFFDQRLSRSGNTSCATCHDPAFGFADPRPVSISDNGARQRRNSPSLLNVGFLPTVMWDGRFRSLEKQSLDPFRKGGDMGLELGEALAIVANDPGYVEAFAIAFGTTPTVQGMGEALSAFQRSLVTGNSSFDKFLFAGEEEALSPLEIRGLDVFIGRASCINCHDIFHPLVNPLGGGIALFTDFRFHNLGVGYEGGRMRDVGRYYVTRSPEDWGAFRTPSLRNVALTAPYMHDGSIETLEEVVDFYNEGGRENPNLSPTLRPLLLAPVEKAALVAFLESLTDPAVDALAAQAQPLPRGAEFGQVLEGD